MAHRIGTGEPCPPMEEQRGWSPGQEDPSCLQWDSSSRRLSQHPTGDRDSRHRMDERRMWTASIGAHRETASTS